MQQNYFDLTKKQKGAIKIHIKKIRMRMYRATGKVPVLTEMELLVHLHKEAKELHEEGMYNNKNSLLHLIPDSTSAGTLGLKLLRNTSICKILFHIFKRGPGSIRKLQAFLVVLVANTLLGYHSEEGWASHSHLLTCHYDYNVE